MATVSEHNYIAVIDFGSQFAHLIARRVRQLGVLAKIFTPDAPAHLYADAKGIILSGGPRSTIDTSAVMYDPGMFTLGVPVLGLCYGHQLIAKHFGGQVERGRTKEYGQAEITILDQATIFRGLGKRECVWMSHWDVVTRAPDGFKVIASTADCPIAAMQHPERRLWSFQFHLEVHHTVHGLKMLENFLFSVCRVRADWRIADIEHDIIREIKQLAGATKKVFLLVSGGVDSTVAYLLLEKALGKKRVYGLHIDNGFMRLHESTAVMAALKKIGFGNIHYVDASTRFLRAGQGLVDPEEKRKVIGELFIEIANEEMGKLNLTALLLGQGTIYPDTIESGGTQHADKIKTHHNRIDLIQEMINQGKVIEPLKDLYKDEVRAIGRRFKLGPKLLDRHPFPGPGLAIRTLCSKGDSDSITNSAKSEAASSDAANLNRQLQAALKRYQATQRRPRPLAVQALPLRSVGVQGDERSYKHPAVIMGKASWRQLNDISIRLTNEVFAINRVLWLVEAVHKTVRGTGASGQQQIAPDATVHERYLTQDRLDLLRVADDIVMRAVRTAGCDQDIWQFPVVLAPFGNKGGGESIILRPIQSQEAMTVNFYQMPWPVLTAILKQLRRLPYLDYIFYDLTNKPPATIEWE